MFLIILLFQLVNAQKVEFDIRDNSLYEYNNISKKNEAIKVDLDSVRFYNADLGIDTTLKYSKKIDIRDILILNSVKNDIIPLEINLNNNSISIKSYENIKNITIYDVLGNEVLNSNVNSKEITLNHNFNNFLYFVQIRTDKNLYKTKVLKAQNTNLISKSIIMSENNWKITLYKFAFKPKTLEYPILPTKIEEELQRIKLQIDYNFNIDSIKESSEHRLRNSYVNDTVNTIFNKNTLLYDTISWGGIYVEININNFYLEREYNSFVNVSNN